MKQALTITVGRRAAQLLAREGWQSELFELVLGASGGPKWLMLSRLDQVLFGDFFAGRQAPLSLVGSSIGSWRHACAAQTDPVAAFRRFERAYLAQEYSSERPTPEEVSAVASDILGAAIGSDGPTAIVEHSVYRTGIVTARAQGLASATQPLGIALGMGAAALANSVHRSLLQTSFQRVVFGHQGPGVGSVLKGFGSLYVPLQAHNVIPALKASGAIPLVLACEHAIDGAPPGPYWDGGIIDYHFDVSAAGETGLVLYPHFADQLTTGWFDKFLPWRRGRGALSDSLVLLSPSREFIASLPFGKIPDRRDITAMDPAERVAYWATCLKASDALANAFRQQLSMSDPLAGVTILD